VRRLNWHLVITYTSSFTKSCRISFSGFRIHGVSVFAACIDAFSCYSRTDTRSSKWLQGFENLTKSWLSCSIIVDYMKLSVDFSRLITSLDESLFRCHLSASLLQWSNTWPIWRWWCGSGTINWASKVWYRICWVEHTILFITGWEFLYLSRFHPNNPLKHIFLIEEQCVRKLLRGRNMARSECIHNLHGVLASARSQSFTADKILMNRSGP
jgi:hypothetical protein